MKKSGSTSGTLIVLYAQHIGTGTTCTLRFLHLWEPPPPPPHTHTHDVDAPIVLSQAVKTLSLACRKFRRVHLGGGHVHAHAHARAWKGSSTGCSRARTESVGLPHSETAPVDSGGVKKKV